MSNLPDHISHMKPFRFFCQKVIPLVYDETLTQYELLCKVVYFLNQVIENENEQNEAINTLIDNFDSLRNFVNEYKQASDAEIARIDAKVDHFIETILDNPGFMEDVQIAVNKWLTDHPEATTTVQDRSLTLNKFTESTLNEVANQKASNTEYAVSKIGNVAQTYISNKNDFIYGGHYTALRDRIETVSNKYEINCSTFVMLLLYGVTYENSAYKKGAGTNILDSELCTDIELFNWFKSENAGQSGDYRYKYTYDLARNMNDKGYCFLPNENVSNIKTGDLLFMKNQTGSESVSDYKDIDHSCIFAYWNSDGTYTVWEVGTLPAAQVYNKSNLIDNCVLVARVPLQNIESTIEDISRHDDPVTTQTNVIKYIKAENFIPNEYYTCVFKLDYDTDISDAYPVIYQGNTRLTGYDQGSVKPKNNIFVLPFVPQVNDDINLRINLRTGSITQPTATLSWYQIYKGIHFYNNEVLHNGFIAGIVKDLNYSPNITITANENFTIGSNTHDRHLLTTSFTGNLATGTNTIASVSGFKYHGNIIPCNFICYTVSGVVSNIEGYVYIGSNGAGSILARNNTGQHITGATLYYIIPVLSK